MKELFGVLVVLVVVVLGILPAQAVSVQSVYYNYDAAPNEPALTVVWGSNQKPPLSIKADQFVLIRNEQTLADIEERIKWIVYDATVDVTPLSQFPADDPVRQDPPILGPAEKIIGSKLYVFESYFAIHIYSLDNPTTPGSELRFLTRFQYGTYGDITGVWW